MTVDDVLALVAAERRRQDMRWGKPRERGLSPETWVAILGEEVGEVCKAALAPVDQADGHDLRHELVQVTAVCGAWTEAMGRTASWFMEEAWAAAETVAARGAPPRGWLQEIVRQLGLAAAVNDDAWLPVRMTVLAGIAMAWVVTLGAEAA